MEFLWKFIDSRNLIIERKQVDPLFTNPPAACV